MEGIPRWNSWGDAADTKFGTEIHATARHGVIAFDSATSQPKGIYGTTDQTGNDLTHLFVPKTIAANGSRAVFHDSGNQGLIKLEITP